MTLVLEILLLEEPEEMAFCTETLKEVCKPVEDCHHLLMNTLIVSTFSCSFDSFKKDVTELFLEDMCKEFVTAYEFVKVDEHKSHLLMNVTDLEKLGAAMADPVATEWDKKNNCQDTVYKIELVD